MFGLIFSKQRRIHHWVAKNLWVYRLPHGRAILATQRIINLPFITYTVTVDGNVLCKTRR